MVAVWPWQVIQIGGHSLKKSELIKEKNDRQVGMPLLNHRESR
jgi:hypothetical protein